MFNFHYRKKRNIEIIWWSVHNLHPNDRTLLCHSFTVVGLRNVIVQNNKYTANNKKKRPHWNGKTLSD